MWRGFASHTFDPLCRQQVTANGYGQLTDIVRSIAERHCGGKLLAVLEGGTGNYMAYCILRVLESLSGVKADVKDPVEGLLVRNFVTCGQKAAIDKVKAIQSAFWKL